MAEERCITLTIHLILLGIFYNRAVKEFVPCYFFMFNQYKRRLHISLHTWYQILTFNKISRSQLLLVSYHGMFLLAIW